MSSQNQPTVTTGPESSKTPAVSKPSTTSDRKPTNNQLSTHLPGPTTYYTGHNDKTGEAIIHSSRPVDWLSYDDDKLSMSTVYTAPFLPDLNQDADVAAHDHKMEVGGGKMGLVLEGGSVLRYVDFAPDFTCMMHRTQSVDFGIVLEGQIVSLLDSGEERLMSRGDVMVQRATMHAW